MKKFLYIFVSLLFFIPFFSQAQSGNKEVVYFYADWCSHCQKVNEHFEKNDFYNKYEFRKYNFDNQKNKILLANILQSKGISNVGIPAIIIDNEIVKGDTPIIDNFESKIENSEGGSFQFVSQFGEGEPDEIIKSEKDKKEDKQVESSGLSLPVLFGAALVDAINPCAFAVLILLVATVIGTKGRRNGLFSGLLFSLAVFISYVLMGFGLYSAITVFNLPKIISIIVGIIAILIGLANLKDALWYGKGFVMEVPFSWRPKMKSIIQKVSSPLGALGAGFVVSLFLLPCTSGPYVVVLGMLANNPFSIEAILYLILYNLIFILPMVAISIGMYFGLRAGKLEKWRQGNIKLLHGIAGVIMLVIGIYLMYNWI